MNENGEQKAIDTGNQGRHWMSPTIQAAKVLLFGLALLFFASLFLEWLGVRAENNGVIALGRIGRAVFCVAILVLTSFIAAIFKIISLGKYSITFYFRNVNYIFLFNIFIALIIYLAPIPMTATTLGTITLISLMISILSLTTPYFPQFAALGIAVFVGLIYFPRWGQKLEHYVIQINQPSLLALKHGDIAAGRTRLFLQGKPAVYYLLRTDSNTYELFDGPGMHDIFPAELQPITDGVARRLVSDEKLISPRNFIEGKNTSTQPQKNDSVSRAPKPAPENSSDQKSASHQPRIIASGKKKVLIDSLGENTEIILADDYNPTRANNFAEESESNDAPRIVELTVKNNNCFPLSFFIGEHFVASVPADSTELLLLDAGEYAVSACELNQALCGPPTHFHWSQKAATLNVDRNRTCGS